MKVFVTGATGYVGAAIVRLLLAEQHEVAGLVRSEASAAKLKQAGGRAVKGAIDDLEVLAVAAADGELRMLWLLLKAGFAGHFCNSCMPSLAPVSWHKVALTALHEADNCTACSHVAQRALQPYFAA